MIGDYLRVTGNVLILIVLSMVGYLFVISRCDTYYLLCTVIL